MAKEKYQLVSNPKSTFSFLRFMMPILGSEWSFAQFRVYKILLKLLKIRFQIAKLIPVWDKVLIK